MELYVIRHAQSLLNIGEGETPNCGLSKFGKQQAEYISEFFNEIPVDAIFCSPLKRVIQTAFPLATRNKTPIQLVPEMCEFFHSEAVDYRDYEWETLQSIVEEFPNVSFDTSYPSENWWPLWPETKENVRQRVSNFHKQVISKYFDTDAVVVVFGHGATTGELKSLISKPTMNPCPNAVIFEYKLNNKGVNLEYKKHIDFLNNYTFNLEDTAY